jgi:hypothetical protein
MMERKTINMKAKNPLNRLTILLGILMISLFTAISGCNTDPNYIFAPPPDIDNFGVSSHSTSDTTDNAIIEIDIAKVLIKDIKVNVSGSGENNFKTGPYVMYLGLNSAVNVIDTGYLTAGTYDKLKFEIHKPNSNETIPDPEFRDSLDTYSVIVKGRFNGIPFTYKSKKSAHLFLTFPSGIIVTESGKTNVTISVNPYTWFIDGGVYLDPAVPGNENTIDNNIKDSFKAFKDDDKNGMPD